MFEYIYFQHFSNFFSSLDQNVDLHQECWSRLKNRVGINFRWISDRTRFVKMKKRRNKEKKKKGTRKQSTCPYLAEKPARQETRRNRTTTGVFSPVSTSPPTPTLLGPKSQNPDPHFHDPIRTHLCARQQIYAFSPNLLFPFEAVGSVGFILIILNNIIYLYCNYFK